MGNVNCNGDEASLLDCEHANTTLCDHNSDAGVDCIGEPKLTMSVLLLIWKFDQVDITCEVELMNLLNMRRYNSSYTEH